MSNNQQMVMNRIKVVLAEKQRTNRWLAEQMGKSENTISRWCSNNCKMLRCGCENIDCSYKNGLVFYNRLRN